MNYNFELLKEFDDNTTELSDFINLSDKTILNEKITAKNLLISQILGHYSQLLIRIEKSMLKDEFNKYVHLQNDISSELDFLNNLDNDDEKLQSLKRLYNKINDSYQNLKTEILTSINKKTILDYNNLINLVNQNILKINSLRLTSEILDELVSLYKNIKLSNDITDINLFLNKTNEVIRNSFNFKTNGKNSENEDCNFSLFVKLNDQIVDSVFENIDGFIYAAYTLEDNRKYYAIVRDENEIRILDQNFSNLSTLVLSKDEIIKTCKVIIKNAGIYYNLNEYMRYIEKSYKSKMSKEIDQVIAKYKTRLTFMENTLNMQLDFIDEIALVVNNRKSLKYSNIIYNDIELKDYFKENKEIDSKEKEINRLILEVLLNPDIKSEFHTYDILKTLYEENIIDSLFSNNFVSSNVVPNVNTLDNINIDINNRKNVETNCDKIANYLNDRLNELYLLENSPKINVTITKDSSPLFKDINTVLDLNTAILICDKVYKKGQGNYAIIDYLKTGNTLKFTSKYKAREIASNVNRESYLNLLIENILMQYVYFKSFNKENGLIKDIDSLLIKDDVNVSYFKNKLLNNDDMLSRFINSFDYDLLNVLASKYKNIEQLIESSNSNLIEKVANILIELKK